MAQPQTEATQPPTRYYFQSLNVLRAVAITLVYLAHVRDLSPLPLGMPVWVYGLGVELFYYVSGFLIGVQVFQTQEWNGGNFLFRRARRLLPAYYVSILLIVGLINSDFVIAPQGLFVILLHVLMFHTFSQEYRGAINGSYWMLGNIFWFYGVVALSARVLRSRYAPWWMLAGLALSYVWRGAVLKFTPPDAELRLFLSSQLPGVLDLYLIGMGSAWLVTKRSLLERISMRRMAPIIAILGVGILAIGIFIRIQIGVSLLAYMTWRTVFGLGISGIVFALLWAEQRVAWYPVLIRKSGINALSNLSYSIFLYHMPVIFSFNYFLTGGMFTPIWAWVYFGNMTLCVLLLATGSYVFVEQRFRAVELKTITGFFARGRDAMMRLLPARPSQRTVINEYARKDQGAATETRGSTDGGWRGAD